MQDVGICVVPSSATLCQLQVYRASLALRSVVISVGSAMLFLIFPACPQLASPKSPCLVSERGGCLWSEAASLREQCSTPGTFTNISFCLSSARACSVIVTGLCISHIRLPILACASAQFGLYLLQALASKEAALAQQEEYVRSIASRLLVSDALQKALQEENRQVSSCYYTLTLS